MTKPASRTKFLTVPLSARPKAYKQDGEAMATFKKTFPSAWRKSVRDFSRAHR